MGKPHAANYILPACIYRIMCTVYVMKDEINIIQMVVQYMYMYVCVLFLLHRYRHIIKA